MVTAVITGSIALGAMSYQIGKKIAQGIKAKKSIYSFIYGQNGDFVGSEFKPGQIHVRVYDEDPTLTKKEITDWLPAWKKHWVDVLVEGAKDKKNLYAKNRVGHVKEIYNTCKREADSYALPPNPKYTTFQEARTYWGPNRADWSVQQELDTELKKFNDSHKKRYKSWKDSKRQNPYPGLDSNLESWSGAVNELGYPDKRPASNPNLNNQGNDENGLLAGLSFLPMVMIGLVILGFIYTKFIKN